MNNGFNKIDWTKFGYAHVLLGVPILLIGLTFESSSSTMGGYKWVPLLLGVLILAVREPKELLLWIYPFSEKSGRGTARYLGLMGLLAYTAARVLPPEALKDALLLNAGLLLIALAVIWYLIRLVRFGEKGL